MKRKTISVLRMGRCLGILTGTAILLLIIISVMTLDNQRNYGYTMSDLYKISAFNTLNETKATALAATENKSDLNKTETTKTLTISEIKITANTSTNTEVKNLLSDEKFAEVKTKMETRRHYLVEKCHELGLDSASHRAYAWEYIVNRQYHVIWCNIFKAASTSWMYNFNIMANYTPEYIAAHNSTPYLELARKKYGRPTVEDIKKAESESISFLIVRHPLERLASAYNDKIVQPWPESFHDKMRQRIVAKYRKKKEDIPYPTFEEFVSYLLDEVRHKRPLDQHWTPYTPFCTPCKFNIDVILKTETLDEDQRYLIQLANLQHVIKPQWVNKQHKEHDVNLLYSKLSRSQLDGLYDLYKYDFQLFDYSIDSYYDILEK